MEVVERIKTFLRTGRKSRAVAYLNSRNAGSMRWPANDVSDEGVVFSLKTVISKSFKCTKEKRAFFETVIPKFRFTKEIIAFFRENPGKTFQDAVDAWYEIKKNKKPKKSFNTEIPPQCEYNQYVRDFLKNNRDLGFKDAVYCWNIKKTLPGDNKYRPEDLTFLKRERFL